MRLAVGKGGDDLQHIAPGGQRGLQPAEAAPDGSALRTAQMYQSRYTRGQINQINVFCAFWACLATGPEQVPRPGGGICPD